MVSALILIILKVVKHRVEVLVLEHADFKYSCFGEHEMPEEFFPGKPSHSVCTEQHVQKM